ncbi:patatin-like phospholipase family protein [Flavobacterium sp. I3-2]|uniref:patatin-like phospholipase family protein n=1 Tax=Flavobacterium sp. I3-2 TaxID=2748319 RepID=UPI0015B0C3A1|nr:patatin-like phospholipase family protein [Flavobacterium sp. I3-2]
MKKQIFFILFCTLCINFIFAQTPQDSISQRPKVGVVLSGGGAKGLAHIGVLKVLEENNVKIDYIGGTSMGAIIGGLYASGYTANQLDSIFREVDVDALIQDYVPRISKSFYEKRNDEIYAIQLPFENFKIGMPEALSKGMYNYNLLSRLLSHVRYERDFNNLPIPFVCIATDIETGKQVVLNSGNLAQNILASGALPSLYSPVEINGKTLIDGGVANNYPIEEVRALGADIIIGVDVQDGLKTKDDLKGAADVLMQINNFAMYEHMNEKIKATTYYVKPDIKGFSVVSFDQGIEIVKRGENAANVYRDDFVALGKLNTSKTKNKSYTHDTDSLHITKIKINKLNDFTSNYVYGKIRVKPGFQVSYDNFSSGIDNLNATQNFKAISYEFESDEENCDVLVLNLKENDVRRYLKFGLHFDNLFKSAILINVTQKKLLFRNDVASLDFGLGDNSRYNFNYFIDNGYLWSIGIQSKMTTLKRNIEDPITSEGIFRTAIPVALNLDYLDFTNRLYFQTYYSERFLIGVGLEHRFNQIDISNLNIDRPWLDKSHYLGAYGNVLFDTYDNKYFPRKGVLFAAEYKNYFHSSDYNNNFNNFSQFNAEIGMVKTFYKKLSVEVKFDMGITFNSEPSTFFKYFFGGNGFEPFANVKPFYGYNFLSVFDDSYIRGQFRIDYEIFKRNHINFSGNYANIGRSIFENSEWTKKPQFTGYAIGYGYQTIIGPIELKYSWSPETKKYFYNLSVGFWF